MLFFIFKIGNSRVVKNIFPEKKALIYENPIILTQLVISGSNEKF